jgi:flagellar biosynthesis/type III secretory pathway M-ring protein FliF/YscJ
LPLLSRPILRIDPLGSRRLGKRLFASVPLSVAQRNNVAMVALALILLVLVAVLVVAIVVSNSEIYDLSIFGAVIPANAAGIFITGAVAMAVTILALLLLRLGVRRARERRTRLKELEASDETPSPTETSTTTTTTKTSSTSVTNRAPDPEATKTKPALDVERESSTGRAERQAMLDEADELTREEPQK